MDRLSFFREFLRETIRGEAVLCTIIADQGSTPRKAGTHMAVFPAGRENGDTGEGGRTAFTVGTVGGGAVERCAIRDACKILEDPSVRTYVREYDLEGTKRDDTTGMICGGAVRILFIRVHEEEYSALQVLADAQEGEANLFLEIETEGLPLTGKEASRASDARARFLVTKKEAYADTVCEAHRFVEPVSRRGIVYLFGLGHVGHALFPVLRRLDFPVTVIDDRAQLTEDASYADATARYCISYDEIAGSVPVTPDDYVIVTTYGHRGDFSVLSQILPMRPYYIGCIGSRNKAKTLNEKLRNAGFPEEDIARIHSPIGLAIGAGTPAEIAISIAAEMTLHRALREGSEVKGKGAPASALMKADQKTVVIRGAGDLASGIAIRLFRAGFFVVMCDTEEPTAIRRTVAFSEAIRCGQYTVEDVTAVLVRDAEEALAVCGKGEIAVFIDPEASCVADLRPAVLVDAIIAKKNLGTKITDAPCVIGVGPGFTAGEDCHAVIETKRGHTLGRVLYEGSAAKNSGRPGDIMGFTTERLLRAPAAGILRTRKEIGDHVEPGDVCGVVEPGGEEMMSAIGGVLRGLLPDGARVHEGMKAGDVDPRDDASYCHSVSDKALSVAGGVLEAVLHFTG